MAFKQQGTGFTGVNDIVNANQNNQLGNTIYSGVQKDVNDVNNKTQTAQSQFNTDVNNANIATDANKQKVSNTLNQVDQDPSKVSAGDVSSFDTFRKGSYAGPSQLNNYSDLQQQGRKVQQLGQDVNNKGGQYDLLKQFVGGNQNYTQGEQNLDSLLLGQTGQPQLQQIKQITQPVMQNIQAAGTQAGLMAANQTSANQAFGQNVTDQIKAKSQALNDVVSNQLKTYQQKDEADRQAYQRMLDMASGKTVTSQGGTPSATPIPDSGTAGANLNGTSDLVSRGLLTPAQAAMIERDSKELNGYLTNPGGDPTSSLSYYAAHGDDRAKQAMEDYNLGNLLSKNLQFNGAKNLDTVGATTAQQAAQLNALSQLGGIDKTYTGGQYSAGNVGFIPNTRTTLPNGVPVTEDQQFRDQTRDAGREMTDAYERAQPPKYIRPGFGGGPSTVICTELNRQGLLSDEVYKLDAEFGKQFVIAHPEAYQGYTFFAAPIVSLMKKSPNAARIVAVLASPWTQHMAYLMEPSIYEDSKWGKAVHEFGVKALPWLYKVAQKCLKRQ